MKINVPQKYKEFLNLARNQVLNHVKEHLIIVKNTLLGNKSIMNRPFLRRRSGIVAVKNSAQCSFFGI